MLLDDALRATLRNFSTLFLVVFAVLGPLHLLYGFVFHDVLALRELHEAISGFPANRQVRGVGQEALARARVWYWVIVMVELALLPVFGRVLAHVLSSDAAGEVPTATGAWRKVRKRAVAARPPHVHVSTALAGVAIGLIVGLLTEVTLMEVADLVPDSSAFGVIALARATGHSAGAAFALVTLLFASGVPSERSGEAPAGS